MVRINLLPQEIVERRRYERFFPYVFIAGAILIAVIFAAWAILQFSVNNRTQELQQTEESTQQLTQQAAKLEVFDKREGEVAARQKAAEEALLGRIDIGRIAEEISLVLPDEVWLQSLVINEVTGVQMVGFTPNTDEQDMTEGYKSVAATLVRVNGLEDAYDVWLTNASSQSFNQYQPRNVVSSDASVPVVGFESTAKIVRDAVPVTAPAQ